MHRHVCSSGLLLSLLLWSSSATSGIHVTLGKYDKWALRSQFLYCHQQQCQGCMRQNFADIMNPFDSDDTENCEGIHEELNAYYWALSEYFGEIWVSFALITRRMTLDAALFRCEQFAWQRHCVASYGSQTGDVPGAYLVGSEFELGQLDREHIDRTRTGPYPVGAVDLRNFVEYCWRVKQEVRPFGSAYWHYATHAAAAYLADAVMGAGGAAKEGGVLGPADVEIAQKLFIHAFVAQQCWELGSWEYPHESYVLDTAGIEYIPFVRDRTPSFYYEIRAAIDHIFPVPVTNAVSSWGGVKMLFERGGRQR